MQSYKYFNKQYGLWGLLFSLVATFILTPYFPKHAPALNLFFVLATVFAVMVAYSNRMTLICGSILGTLNIAVTSIEAVVPTAALSAISLATIGTFFTYLAVSLLRKILNAPRVSTNTLLAAICTYLAFAVIWAMAYGLLEYFQPGSFKLNGELITAQNTDNFMYFSVVTLTTLGYGDIVPATNAGQALAAMEAVVGQIYLTVLVALLVGHHIADAHSEGHKNDTEVNKI